MTRIAWSLFCSLAVTLSAFGLGSDVVRTAADLSRIAYDEGRIGVRFEIEAVVTQPFRDRRISNAISVEDSSGGVLVKDRTSGERCRWKLGDLVRISGITEEIDGTSVYAVSEAIEFVRHGPRTQPIPADYAGIRSGKYDRRTVIVRGMLTDITGDDIDPNWAFLVVNDGSGAIYCAIQRDCFGVHLPVDLLDAEIAVEGICTPSLHSTRRFIDHTISIYDRSFITVLTPARQSPFDAPELVDTRKHLIDARPSGGRRRIEGEVIAVWHGNRILVKASGGKIVRATLTEKNPPFCDAWVQVVGFPEADFYRISLSRAIWRSAPSTHSATDRRESDRVDANLLLRDKNGRPKVNIDYYGRTIRMCGTLRTAPAPGNDMWQANLQDGDFIIPLYANESDCFKNAEPNSVIEVTGVCLMETEVWRPQTPFPHINGMAIVLRSAGDIRIISHPPWWTPARLLAAIAALVAILVAILFWNASLRILAERRGRALLRREIESARSELKVLERTRLAVELHDSFAQGLSGVAMEMETALQYTDGALPSLTEHLSSAWTALRSCRQELRDCLWDLRNKALEDPDMEQAIRRTLLPHITDVTLVIRFPVPRQRLTDNTAHAILRIIRELTVNAIRHGAARTIRVAGSIDARNIQFSVTDDGAGFDPNACPGIQQGHFGLEGIRERLRPLFGTLCLDTSPGRGCKARGIIPIAQPGTRREP